MKNASALVISAFAILPMAHADEAPPRPLDISLGAVAGIHLGDKAPRTPPGRFEFAGHDASVRVATERGKVVQLTVWIDCFDRGGGGSRADLERALRASLGRRRSNLWIGQRAVLREVQQPFDFSGSCSFVLVLVPPGEAHVCGKRDGFARFYRRFARAVARRDWVEVASQMTLPQRDWDDVEGADLPVQVANRADVAKKAGDLFPARLRGAIVRRGARGAVCDAGGREYVIRYGSERLAPAIYAGRDAAGRWRITAIGHAPHDLF